MAAVKKAWDDSLLRSMEGLPVYFQVNNDGLKVEKVSKELVDSSFSKSKLNQEKIILDKDTAFYGLLTPQEMEGKLSIVGGKAAHFGELHTAVKKLKLEAKLPELYQHLQAAGAGPEGAAGAQAGPASGADAGAGAGAADAKADDDVIDADFDMVDDEKK